MGFSKLAFSVKNGLFIWLKSTEFRKIMPFLFNLVKLLHQSRNIQQNKTASMEIL